MTRALGVLLAAILVLAGCTSTGEHVDDWPGPDPSRPVVDLRFEVADDLHSVEGREHVDFTPDQNVCELAFRAWPNKPSTASAGNSLEVTDVWVDGARASPVVRSAGAPAGHPGTLIEVPLTECVAAGDTISAELSFTLTLGKGTDERVGVATTGDLAWFATAFPLLAWERGSGWATEPAVDVVGEMTTSETFHLRDLTVIAPSEHEVMGTGAAVDAQPGGAGTTVHRFSDPAVRDVAVTVGDLAVVDRELAGVRVHVGVPQSGTQSSPARWAEEAGRAIDEIAERLGPFPYTDLWVSVVPDQTDGIESSGALQFGDLDLEEEGWLVTHEVAHMWFYGLVGNNQALDPWLDESFATFVQVLADGEDISDSRVPQEVRGRVGQPMSFWAEYRRPSAAYVAGIYTAGGSALLDARRRTGPEDFDEALRRYLTDNAHRIAEPADVEQAFAHLPVAVDTLREAGALAAEEP